MERTVEQTKTIDCIEEREGEILTQCTKHDQLETNHFTNLFDHKQYHVSRVGPRNKTIEQNIFITHILQKQNSKYNYFGKYNERSYRLERYLPDNLWIDRILVRKQVQYKVGLQFKFKTDQRVKNIVMILRCGSIT